MIIIDSIQYKEFKKIVEFMEKEKDKRFKVIPRAGFEIFDIENNEKMGDISCTSGLKEVHVRLWLNTGFGSTRKLSKQQKLDICKDIYFEFKNKYQENS